MPSNVYSIRERNLMFFLAIEEILGTNKGKTWTEVRRALSNDQVKRIHTVYSALWPIDTNIAELLARPDERVFRALYVGLIDPRTIKASVVGWLRYFDEILLISPFVNAAGMRPEYSPVDSPEQYKEQTIKNIVLLADLVPFIDEGVVHLLPDPLEFNDDLRRNISKIVERKKGTIELTNQDQALAKVIARDDLTRFIARLPDHALERELLRSSPDLNGVELRDVIRRIRDEHAQDPLALIQPLVAGEEGGQVQMFRGINFELAVFLAQLCGAAVYTDQRITRNDLDSARNSNPDGSSPGDGTQQDLVLDLDLEINLDSDLTSSARHSPASHIFRKALRSLWQASLKNLDTPSSTGVGEALGQLERLTHAETEKTPNDSGKAIPDDKPDNVWSVRTQIVIPPAGYRVNAVHRFLVTFGRKKHIKAVPMAILFGSSLAPVTNSEARPEPPTTTKSTMSSESEVSPL